MEEIFIQWLHDNDLHADYDHLLFMERRISVDEFLKEETEHEHYMDGAFIFPRRERDFWWLADKKWKLYLKEILTNKR